MAERVRLLICIPIMFGSNPSCDTGYPELKSFVLLVSLSKENSLTERLITARQLPFISFPIHDFLTESWYYTE
jgi:hypothetical protein